LRAADAVEKTVNTLTDVIIGLDPMIHSGRVA